MNSKELHRLESQQMERETDTWLRLMDFLRQENINHKNRLSEVIQNDVSLDMLERLEGFQNSFITKDAVLELLTKDIKQHKKNVLAASGKDIWPDTLTATHDKLRVDAGKADKEFMNLWMGFNEFLVGMFRF